MSEMVERGSMIERVARALEPDVWANFDAYVKQKEFTRAEVEHRKTTSLALRLSTGRARAAIEALREPTPAMIEAAKPYLRYGEVEAGTNIWAAFGGMIDAALGLQPKGQPSAPHDVLANRDAALGEKRG